MFFMKSSPDFVVEIKFTSNRFHCLIKNYAKGLFGYFIYGYPHQH